MLKSAGLTQRFAAAAISRHLVSAQGTDSFCASPAKLISLRTNRRSYAPPAHFVPAAAEAKRWQQSPAFSFFRDLMAGMLHTLSLVSLVCVPLQHTLPCCSTRSGLLASVTPR